MNTATTSPTALREAPPGRDPDFPDPGLPDPDPGLPDPDPGLPDPDPGLPDPDPGLPDPDPGLPDPDPGLPDPDPGLPDPDPGLPDPDPGLPDPDPGLPDPDPGLPDPDPGLPDPDPGLPDPDPGLPDPDPGLPDPDPGLPDPDPGLPDPDPGLPDPDPGLPDPDPGLPDPDPGLPDPDPGLPDPDPGLPDPDPGLPDPDPGLPDPDPGLPDPDPGLPDPDPGLPDPDPGLPDPDPGLPDPDPGLPDPDPGLPDPDPGVRPRTGWYRLEVTEVRRLTGDAVAVGLHVPAALREVFAHRPGQHVVVRHRRADGELRRSYSVCPPPHDPRALRLVIKRGGPDGFGAHATGRLAPGDRLELSPPTGSFALPPTRGVHHVLLAGGSGITPLAAMAAHALRGDPACRVSLVHWVPTAADALLADELALLKDEFVDRFTVLHVLTREDRGHGDGDGPFGGRMDAGRLSRLLAALDARPAPDTAFALCGPSGLVDTARRALTDLGADPALVRWEVFTAAGAPSRTPQRTPGPADPAAPDPAAPDPAAPDPTAAKPRVTALLDGRRIAATVLPQDPAILDALLRDRPDVPYACREGVCGSCRAKVVSGRVAGEGQYALDERDRAAGYTLVCRTRPSTPEVTLDFDA